MTVSSADLARLSVELHARFPQEEGKVRLEEWLAASSIDEEAFDMLVQASISGFKDMLDQMAKEGEGESIEAEDRDGNQVDMVGIEVSALVGSIACNMFILGYETATEYGQRDMSHTDD